MTTLPSPPYELYITFTGPHFPQPDQGPWTLSHNNVVPPLGPGGVQRLLRRLSSRFSLEDAVAEVERAASALRLLGWEVRHTEVVQYKAGQVVYDAGVVKVT